MKRADVRVLIIDDSSVARINERNVLENMGFRHFSEAADGAQALAMLARESFDLIVTDYRMPVLDGLGLISQLKMSNQTHQTPIVMVTAETEPIVLEAIRRLGVEEIFRKDFDPRAVRPVMERLFPDGSVE